MSVVLAPFRGRMSEFGNYIQTVKQIPAGASCASCGRTCKCGSLGPKGAGHVVCGRWMGMVPTGSQ